MMLIGDQPQSYPSYRDIAGAAVADVENVPMSNIDIVIVG
jgi:hypothetical protein